MKILYAIQATGNGHISRAGQIIPYLENFGHVDTMLSGSNASLQCDFDVTYKSKGLSLFYRRKGGLDFQRMFVYNSFYRARKDARSLPVEQYDLVLNDFDYITALACRMKGVRSVQFGHQASFVSPLVPRPAFKNPVGEYVLRNYALATDYLGLHFKRYDSNIFTPIIKDRIMQATPIDKGHVTVYMPAFDKTVLSKHFWNIPDMVFHYFNHDVKTPYVEKNIHYFPISNDGFVRSMVDSHGIITGAGFETPSEALYLEKKLMCIPIRRQYEQACNAAALEEMGVCIIDDVRKDKWTSQIEHWLNAPRPTAQIEANDINATLRHIMEMRQSETRALVRPKGVRLSKG